MCWVVNKLDLASSAATIIDPDVRPLVNVGLSTGQVPVDNVVAWKEALDGTLNVRTVCIFSAFNECGVHLCF